METEIDGKMVRVQTDDYALTQIATGAPCFQDDYVRNVHNQSVAWIDGGTAPSHNCSAGTVIYSDRAGNNKRACQPSDFGLVWLKIEGK